MASLMGCEDVIVLLVFNTGPELKTVVERSVDRRECLKAYVMVDSVTWFGT
jgi:hypothetical protein